ncbi:MAG: zinc ribbon domain-containing protein [Oscillospiraceae bacterium]|nr:zinc ribbon domain-containing protein [Oscillospiraceae bacterium]
MFCVNCGAKLEDGAKFCTQCGAQQAVTENAVTEETAAPVEETATVEEEGDVEITGLVLFGKTFSKKVVTIAAAALAAVILLVILVVALLPGSASPKGAAEEYVKAVFACEADEIIAVMPPDALKTIYKNNDMRAKEYENRMDEIMESMDEDMDDYFGARRKVSVKVEQTKKLNKSELRSLKEIYKDAKYGSVSDARIMKVRISLNGSEESGSGTVKVSVVKQGGRWFINPLDTNPYTLIYAID